MIYSKLNYVGLSAFVLLAACASKPTTTTTASNTAGSRSTEAAALPPAGPATDGTNQSGNQGANSGLYGNGYGAGQTAANPYAGQVLATLGDRVFFATDSYSLSEEARATLNRQAAWMNGNPNSRLLVAGNCDERGTREYNLALGARRANAVKDFLVSLGVNTNRIETVSYGKERPIDDRPNESGWAINRNSHSMPIN